MKMGKDDWVILLLSFILAILLPWWVFLLIPLLLLFLLWLLGALFRWK